MKDYRQEDYEYIVKMRNKLSVMVEDLTMCLNYAEKKLKSLNEGLKELDEIRQA